MARTHVSAQPSGANTPVLSKHSSNEETYVTIPTRPHLRKHTYSGNSVSFVGEENEEEGQGAFHTVMKSPLSASSSTFNNARSSANSSTKVKLRPLRSKKSTDTPTLDLSKSMAENEMFAQHKFEHTRSSSGYSTMTNVSTGGRATQYRYGPAYSSPMMRSKSRTDSAEDLSSSRFATRTPPALHIRTHSSSSNPRLYSPSQTHLEYPASAASLRGEGNFSESMGRSGRSSFDSVFRRRARSNAESDPVAAAAIVREEWFARQAAKQRKREEEESRLKERAERRQVKASGSTKEARSRAETINTLASTDEKGSTISAIRYRDTKPGLPVDKELEYIRAGIRPPLATRSSASTTIKKKARGTKNGFEKFFYNLYTSWLKFLQLVGVKRSSP